MKIKPDAFLAFSQDCADCTSEKAFQHIVDHRVQQFLPHGLLAAVVGRLDLQHLEILRFVSVSYPQGLLQQLPRSINLSQRPVVRRWLNTREPQVVTLPEDAAQTSERERWEIENFNLGRLAIHGVLDLSANTGTYFSFGQVAGAIPTQDVLATLKLITPALHQALLQLHQYAEAAPTSSEAWRGVAALSPAERELAQWLISGRTNAEIATLRERSVATVRNQLHSVFAKLGVATRTEAASLLLRISVNPARQSDV